jgi:hypothetical protein
MDAVRACLAEKTYASAWWDRSEPDEAFSSAWKDFRQQLLHRTRFVFWAHTDDSDQHREIPIAQVLQQIGDLLASFNCIKTLPAGTLTYPGTGARGARGFARLGCARSRHQHARTDNQLVSDEPGWHSAVLQR